LLHLHLLQAAAKLLPHLNHLQSHCKDDQLHVVVAVLHDTAVVAADYLQLHLLNLCLLLLLLLLLLLSFEFLCLSIT
jgi:hypothetical protein